MARRSDLRYSVRLLRRNFTALIGAVIVGASIIVALLSDVLVNPAQGSKIDLIRRLCWNNSIVHWIGPGINNCGGPVFALGSDAYGRDLLRMMILAMPLDIEVSIEVVLFGIAVGFLVGGLAAYLGGIFDEVILRITDIFFVIPTLLLALIIVVALGRSIENLTFAIMITTWPIYVRLARSQILSEKGKPYVESLQALGIGRLRILFRHIIPNTMYSVIVQGTLELGRVIIIFSSLTFLGFSPNPLLPELGNLINEGIDYVFTAPWLIVFPGIVIFALSIGFNLLGDGIRDIFDPRLRR